jgi:hypothetical protein
VAGLKCEIEHISMQLVVLINDGLLLNPSCHLAGSGQVLTQRRRVAKEKTITTWRLSDFALRISIKSGPRNKGSNLRYLL